ncbi:homocysteine-responsive endoplasmic reticulum-resident ubiquitin-like domain member 2 protein isoform X2 [Ambystoma mexicanum]|uniref:homocysteine-responsive endoplasmic reticulum-resident ubiquitin-like domain member 2 protein isoform X2 n=1 Tax=Ambystoma mexicanum TaxID=8296 RepID=UPI0037E994B1
MDTSFIDSPVRLVIKAPSQKYDDQTIDCFLDWTVENLKHHLSKVYPSKPSLKDQRLVYSGKLLLDHLRLKDVLRKQDEYHMVHLVCSTLTPPSSPKSNSSTELVGTSSDLSSSNVEYLGSTTASTSATLNTASEVFRARNHPPVQPSNVQNPAAFYFTQGSGSRQFSQHGTPVGLPQYPAIHPVHLLWWQHMYARQSYLQYHAAAISALSASNHQQASPVPPSRVQSEVVIQNEQAAAPNLAPQENRPVNQNVQMNAQGGPVMNEEDFNRDWLDWMYTFTRATILFSIVYFYSSFSRFVMMMGAMLLVFLHQARWFPFRQNGDPRPAANQDANLNNDLQNERLMDDGLDDEGGEDAAEETRPEQQPGLLTSAWTFITAFFISLIPEGPPPAQN